jgi:hypothetical protein
MSRLMFMLTAAGFLAATLASGWLHGTLANRWGQGDQLTLAAARLDGDLPPRLGPWRLAKTLPMDSEVRKSLQCCAALHGIYTNDQTGLRVVYGWSSGGPWQAVQRPRFALAGLPVVYKLQLAGPAREDQREQALDPSHDFLTRFLAEIQPRLIDQPSSLPTS